jgi:hypothetical protein
MVYLTTKKRKGLLIRLLSLPAFILLLSLNSCYYDNEEALYPQWPGSDVCDTTSLPTYTNNIQSVISKYCVSCHYTGSSDRVPLDSYDNLTLGVINYSLKDHLTENGKSVMPPSGKLTDCKISLIQRWVDNQMPN